MGKVIAYILSGFATLIPALVAFFSRKYTVASASLVAFAVITATFIVCIKQFVVTVAAVLVFPSWLATIAWFIPPNFIALFSLIVSGRTCAAAYDIAKEKIRLINAAS